MKQVDILEKNLAGENKISQWKNKEDNNFKKKISFFSW